MLPVLILIALLGHPAHSTRELAHAVAVRVVMLTPGPFLQGRQSDDAEVAARCRVLVRAWQRRYADAIARDMRPANGWPWIDGHVGDGGPVCREAMHGYLDWARETADYNAPDWRASSLATEYLVRAIVADGGCPMALLARLVECEAKWRAANGYRPRTTR